MGTYFVLGFILQETYSAQLRNIIFNVLGILSFISLVIAKCHDLQICYLVSENIGSKSGSKADIQGQKGNTGQIPCWHSGTKGKIGNTGQIPC